jgi:hypothetical protein
MPDAAATSIGPAPTRTLVPHEHGAYGQLVMPLVTAYAVGSFTAAAVALGAAFVLAFVAHESLLVVLGQRGKRALEADGPRARRLLFLLGGLALLSGVVGVLVAPPLARLALLPIAALAVLIGWLVARRLEKTLAGEILVAATLSSAGLAVALAGHAPLSWALACWITWTLAFAVATLAVQVILVRARSKGRSDPGLVHALVSALLLVGAFVASAVAGLPRAAPLALVPTALLSMAVCVGRFSPKRLRELGWAMVGSSVLTMVILVAGLR